MQCKYLVKNTYYVAITIWPYLLKQGTTHNDPKKVHCDPQGPILIHIKSTITQNNPKKVYNCPYNTYQKKKKKKEKEINPQRFTTTQSNLQQSTTTK